MTDADYQEHLENVDAVRWNQLRLLPELAARYGLKKVYIERLTELDMPAMPDKLARLRDARAGQSELAKQLADVRRMLETAPPGERRDKLVAVQKEIVGLIEAYNLEMTQLGAAFSLVLNGQLEVAPLDTAALLDAANPVKDGVMAPDPAANAKRERGMISNVLNGGPVVVLICGGAHDLKSAIREIAGPDTEYVRITIYSYQGGTK
jgi:hypothetical protein